MQNIVLVEKKFSLTLNSWLEHRIVLITCYTIKLIMERRKKKDKRMKKFLCEVPLYRHKRQPKWYNSSLTI